MGKHRAQGHKPRFKLLLGGALLSGAALTQLFNGGSGIASADTGSPITIFGDTAYAASSSADPSDWDKMMQIENAELTNHYHAMSEERFMSQFDNLYGQSPDQIAAVVSQTLSQQFNHSWTMGWTSPVETIEAHQGDARAFVAVEAKALVREGVDPGQVFVTRVTTPDKPELPYTVLIVGKAPGVVTPDSTVIGNFQNAAQANNPSMRKKIGDDTTLLLVDARDMKGTYFSPKSGPGMG